MTINTIESLRSHLQTALELEHCTIPPYLCSLYSIKEGSNQLASQIIRSVVMEEMLHMTLVSNLLNSIGGKPSINHPQFIPVYPGYMPKSSKSFIVPLMKFCRQAVEVFLKIEKPEKVGAKPEGDYYHSIGQFYKAIEAGFERLDRDRKINLFCGKPENQLLPDTWYYGAGKVVEVTDLESAKLAITEISEQGEGLSDSIADGDHRLFQQQIEVAHYYRFNEIYLGRQYTEDDTPQSGPSGPELPVNWNAVYDMRPNPKVSQYLDYPEILEIMHRFNCTYMDMLDLINDGFNGKRSSMMAAVTKMYELKDQATSLMNIPSGEDNTTVGPSFEYVPPEYRNCAYPHHCKS